MENADPAHGDPDSEDTVTIEQKVITRLNKAIEADSTSDKNYHIRSAHQLLLATEDLSEKGDSAS
jgi:hypothetical protein